MKKNEVKLTGDEMSEILMLNNEYQEILIKFGQLQLQKIQIENETKQIEKFEKEYLNTYTEIEKSEKKFKERISRKYGDGEIDIEEGIYIQTQNNS
nr:hypothetical protein [uncultured Mediterranean phage uvMED]|tara:strand:- start:237 stop:524 length:288 start_codon:yes stop_codon:yes gene_type:complete